MLTNFRCFDAGPDRFGRTWTVEFQWLQTGISIRHADTVDCKFSLSQGSSDRQEKVIALGHVDLLELAAQTGRALTDAWAAKLAALHLKLMIETDRDMEKTLVTANREDLERASQALAGGPAEA